MGYQRWIAVAGSIAALGVFSCSSGGELGSSNSAGGAAGSGGSAGGSGSAGEAGQAGSGAGGSAGGGAGGGTAGMGGTINGMGGGMNGGEELIYAHTADKLFKLDPKDQSFQLQDLGTIDCIGDGKTAKSMTDLAVDKDGVVWGISADFGEPNYIYTLTPPEEGSTGVSCGPKINVDAPGNERFFGLTFAPTGVISGSEVLIAGNTAGELWVIGANGKATQHGSFGTVPANDGNGNTYDHPGKAWRLSGDIVFLANEGTPVGFATVRDCEDPAQTSSCSKIDTLIEIDMAKLKQPGSQNVTKSIRGKIVPKNGCDKSNPDAYYKLFGIAAWGDKVYGFSAEDALIEVGLDKGEACLVKNAPSTSFYGAGVTTLAKVQAPPPKLV